jgi:hypothetical protein
MLVPDYDIVALTPQRLGTICGSDLVTFGPQPAKATIGEADRPDLALATPLPCQGADGRERSRATCTGKLGSGDRLCRHFGRLTGGTAGGDGPRQSGRAEPQPASP